MGLNLTEAYLDLDVENDCPQQSNGNNTDHNADDQLAGDLKIKTWKLHESSVAAACNSVK